MPWGDVFHDFLDRLGISFDAFCNEFTGSWMFGYAAALRAAGVHTLLICPTSHVSSPLRATHRPTGARLLFLPTPRLFGWLRARALEGRLGRRRDPVSIARAGAAHVAPYLGTPPLRLARLLRNERCRAILCQEYEDPRFDVTVGVGRAVGIPVFGVFQGADYQLSRLERPIRPLALRACRGLVIGPSAEAARVSKRYRMSEERIARIPNPIDLAAWGPGDRLAARATLGIPEGALLVVWHGQVQIRRKGLDTLLDGWAELVGIRPDRDLRLLLIGSGEDTPELRTRIEEHGTPGVELMDGWVHDRFRLREILTAGDVYVFPSRHEGLPVAPLEAMACGLPVVGADATGVGDVVGDGGVIVPAGDHRALAAALGDLLDDDGRRRELGAAARARVEERFSLESVGAQLRQLILGDSA